MNGTNLIRLSIATLVGSAALSWSGDIPRTQQQGFVSSAHAIIGRPLTPMSYAGVARRTTAQVVVGAGAVVVAPAPVVVAPVCAQAVDVYGRIMTVFR
jgi:hypothetical protein